jgi:ribosome recycling factor
MIKTVVQQAERDMKKAAEAVAREFGGVRTGRASLALLEGIQVESYGALAPLHQVANLAVPDRRVITIQPWDPRVLPAIERAILKSDLGITPANDGKLVRLTLPPLTEERRKELGKVVRRMAEEGRVVIRNLRREANDRLKALEKEKQISEDDLKRATQQVQDLTNRTIKDVDDALAKKEKEILEF